MGLRAFFSLASLHFVDTDEELKEWKTKFEERIAILESKVSKLEREMNDLETKSSFLKQAINEYIWEISKLQTEAEVSHLCPNFNNFIPAFYCRKEWVVYIAFKCGS